MVRSWSGRMTWGLICGALLLSFSGWWWFGPSLVQAEETTTGAIRGTVVYRSDAARPWRYGRYYIKNKQTGRLAEAVVALDGAGLKDLPATEPVEHLMDQKDYRFVPETLAIRAGDQVTFSNSDPQLHNVRATGTLKEFDTTVRPETKTSETFARGGGMRRPVVIGCKLHSVMRAWIYVFAHPFHALTGGAGTFTWEGIPPGEYRLEVSHPAGGLAKSQKVQVRAGETLEVEFVLSPADLVAAE